MGTAVMLKDDFLIQWRLLAGWRRFDFRQEQWLLNLLRLLCSGCCGIPTDYKGAIIWNWQLFFIQRQSLWTFCPRQSWCDSTMLRLRRNNTFYTPIARLLYYRLILLSHNTLRPTDINEKTVSSPFSIGIETKLFVLLCSCFREFFPWDYPSDRPIWSSVRTVCCLLKSGHQLQWITFSQLAIL
jgi:hypothetical protein